MDDVTIPVASIADLVRSINRIHEQAQHVADAGRERGARGRRQDWQEGFAAGAQAALLAVDAFCWSRDEIFDAVAEHIAATSSIPA